MQVNGSNIEWSKKWCPCSRTTKSVVAVLISLPYEMLMVSRAYEERERRLSLRVLRYIRALMLCLISTIVTELEV